MGAPGARARFWKKCAGFVRERLRRASRALFVPRGRGREGERAAARFLAQRGLRILARNVREGRGEIDLVALEGETLVFVEVKSRRAPPGSEWTGLENVDRRKRRALRRACLRYRRRFPFPVEGYRVDVVAVEFGERGVRSVRWYRGILDLDAFVVY
ncbi:MAG: YraN family protein [Planctomycetota bacterium]